MDVTSGILIGVIVFIITGLMAWGAKKLLMVDSMKESIKEIKEGFTVILTCLLPLLLCQKEGKANGELDKALEVLNNYLIKMKGS